MTKLKTNSVVDILAFIALLVSALTGIILKFVLPRGSGKLGSIFLGILRESWLEIHDISSIAFIVLVLVHLILHWNWIKCIPRFFKGAELCEK